MSTSFIDWDSGLYLQHHGIKGMKWGVRRYQNEDGTLTPAGKKRDQKRFYKKVKQTTKLARKADKVDFKRIADVDYDDRHPSARVDKRLLSDYDTYHKTKDSVRELVELGKKWDQIGEKANDYNNYVYNRYREGKIPKQVTKKQERLNASDKAAMKAYTGKSKSIADDLLGKYGKKKLVVDRIFGMPVKKKASDIVEGALRARAARTIDYERRIKAGNRL